MTGFFRRLRERLRRQPPSQGELLADEAGRDRTGAVAGYSSDQPIRNRSQDRFGRWTFAERVARTLAERNDPSSVVVGIYGAWGDGKTSTLRLMEEALAGHANTVVVPFNPWQFESQEQLLRSFFDALAARLGRSLPTRAEELGRILQRYGRVLSLLSVGAGPVTISAGDAVERVGEALSTVELDELRKRLEKILAECRKRIVVFVDDIDRLDRGEIQATFKLIKLSASFDHTSYVLAFDDGMVAEALGEKYGAGGSEAGRAFLEKIVQVPLHLPPADELALRKLTLEGVDEAVRLAGIELSEAQTQAFVRHYIDGLEPRVTTPRQARLYGNVLAFALPILRGEVNPVDQMLIEGIRVFYPRLYALIRDRRDLFMTRTQERGPTDARRQQAIALLDEAMAGTGVSREVIVLGLLKVVFPRIETLLGNTFYADDWDKQWERDQRICSEHYSDRFFRYGVPPGDVSDREVAGLVEGARTESEAAVQTELVRIAGTDGMRKLITKLRHREGEIAAEGAGRLAMALARSGAIVPRDKSMLVDDWTLSQAGILVRNMVRQVPAGAERDALARRVVQEGEPLVFGAECFRWLRKGKEEAEAARTVSQEVEEELGKILAARIRVVAAAGAFHDLFGSDTPRLLFVWKRYGGDDEVGVYLRGRLEANAAETDRLLDVFVGTSWGIESGLSRKADLERDSYNAIANLLDPQFVFDKLRMLHPGLSGAEYPYAGDMEQSRRLAEQFASVHQRAMAEANQEQGSGEKPDGATETPD